MTLFLISMAIIALTAWLVRRLFGIVHGRWVLTIAAALFGQAAAIGVLMVATGDAFALTGAWVVVGAALSVVLSMVVVVVVELVERRRTYPRQLAVPHPVRSVRRATRRARRYAQVSAIAVRQGLFGGRREAAHEVQGARLGRSLAATLEESGGLFVKLGQAMAAQPQLVTPAVAAELRRLGDRVSPADPQAALEVLQEELGPLGQVFSSFDREPLAAASIGQTYVAVLRDGREVVVKVQRPGVADSVECDLDILTRLASRLEERTTWARSIGLVELAAGFGESTRAELDYRVEAANGAAARAALREGSGDGYGPPTVSVPRVMTDLTSRRVLVQERVAGRGIGSAGALDGLDAAQRRALADSLLSVQLGQMLSGAPFHADLHPGNVMLRDDGGLALIDFGAVGRLDRRERSALVDIFSALAQEDPALLRQGALTLGVPAARVDTEAMERELARLMSRNLGPRGSLAPGVFGDVVVVLRDFGVSLPRSAATLFRALGVALATLELLCPGYDLVSAVKRTVGRSLTPVGRPDSLRDFVQHEVLGAAPVLARLPRDVDDLLRSLARGEVRTRVSLLSEPEDLRAVHGIVNRVLVAVVGAALVVASALLLTVQPQGGGVGVVGAIGAIGLFLAALLLLRLVRQLLRELS